MRLPAGPACKQNPPRSRPLPGPPPRPLGRWLFPRLGPRLGRPPPLGLVLPGRRLQEVLATDAEGLRQRHETGFTLTTWDERNKAAVRYDLPLSLDSCDCPDVTYRGERPGGCKH